MVAGIASTVFGSAQQLALAGESGKLPQLSGKQLVEKNGCLHCHYMRGDGGLIGPPFEGIGKYRSEQDIVVTLTNKRQLPDYYPKNVFDPREFMRHVKLEKSTAEKIAKYLVTTPEEPSFEVRGHGEDDRSEKPDSMVPGFHFRPNTPTAVSRKGLIAFKEGGCAACHSIAGVGGSRAPHLDGVGARLNKTSIANRIAGGAILMLGGKEYRPTEYSMPPAELPPEQISEITEFLLTLPEKKNN